MEADNPMDENMHRTLRLLTLPISHEEILVVVHVIWSEGVDGVQFDHCVLWCTLPILGSSVCPQTMQCQLCTFYLQLFIVNKCFSGTSEHKESMVYYHIDKPAKMYSPDTDVNKEGCSYFIVMCAVNYHIFLYYDIT